MAWLPCPYLGRDVELTAERERHIRRRHRDLLPGRRAALLDCVREPDLVLRRDWRPSQLLFARRLVEGSFEVVVVAVVEEDEAVDDSAESRMWVMTAYLSPRLPDGLVLWTR